MSEKHDAVLRADDYVLLFLFFNLPDSLIFEPGEVGGDFMGVVYRARNEGPWMLDYRFRYYRDEKIFGSADRRSRYTKQGQAWSESRAAQLMMGFVHKLLTEMSAIFGAAVKPEVFFVRDYSARLHALIEAGQVPEWFHGTQTTT